MIINVGVVRKESLTKCTTLEIVKIQSDLIGNDELTKMFDIDHLYLASLNYAFDGELTEAEKLQNKLLTNMLTILNDVENSTHTLFKSVDNDTELLTNIAKRLPEVNSYKSHAYNYGTLHEQINRRNDYVSGKFGIGPFALNVTNHALARIFGVKFKETKFVDAVGIGDLGKLMDIDGNYIDSWISAFINAHVDIVKDPYISKMNVNKYTYNMVNLLTRTGFGEVGMWFIAQPVIVDMANANNSANSQFIRTAGTSIYSQQKEAIANAVENWIPKNNITEDRINKLLDFTNEASVQDAIECVMFIKNNKDLLSRIAIEGHNLMPLDELSYKVGDKTERITVSEVQEKAFLAWKLLEKYSIALGNLVQRTKIDTKKHGKSLLSVYNYYINYNNLIHPNNPDQSLFDVATLDNLVTNSWIEKKTQLSCTLPFTILGGQVFEGNQRYLQNITDIYNTLHGDSRSIQVDQLEAINKAVKAQIKSHYIVNYAKEFLGKTDQDITNLFVGKRCMAYRLNMLNSAIRTMPKYNRLANNPLVKSLYTLEDSESVYINGVECKRPCFISIADTIADGSSNSDIFVDGWLDLLNDHDSTVRAFARDLIVYAYMTSGEDAGWNNLFKYVPSAWMKGEVDRYESFANFVSERLRNGDTADFINLDDIVANNYSDYTFCRRLPFYDKNRNQNVIFNSNDGLIAVKPVDTKEPIPTYISYKSRRGSYQYAYNTYKLLTVLPSGENTQIPIYMSLGTKGFQNNRKQKVLEYGWKFNYGENANKEVSENYNEFAEKLSVYIQKHPNTVVDPNRIANFITAVNQTAIEEVGIKPTVVQTNVTNLSLEYDSMSEVSMYSGGMHGADTAWDFYARKNGVTDIVHFRSNDDCVLPQSLYKRGSFSTILTDEHLQQAREKVYKLLGITYDANRDGNLQVSNYYKVLHADAVFAVASMTDNHKAVSENVNSAIQLGITMKKPVHLFDINTESWYQFNQQTNVFETESTPILTESFAGIGTSDIENYKIFEENKWVDNKRYVGDDKSKIALNAIQDVFAKTQSVLNDSRIEDTRQTDFLKELGVSDEDMKKAEEIKNHCKGGK